MTPKDKNLKRPIKFRAWDKQNKEMVDKPVVSSFDWSKGSQGGTHKTLMQYIGLVDKRGREIYEGDIVSLGRNVSQRRVIGRWEDKPQFGYVYPTGEQFGEISFHRSGFMKDEMEVIGNVYENPDLLP